MSLSGSLLLLAALLPDQAPATDFAYNFRSGVLPSPDRMALAGVDKTVEVTPEEGGLRIKILGNRTLDGVGMETKFPLTGDFEITASYEILSAEPPTKGYGVGVNLAIMPADWQHKMATLFRNWTVENGSIFQTRIKLTEPMPLDEYHWEPTETLKGQLRLRREGTSLSYLVNEGLGQPFREINRVEYGTDNIDRVRLVANTGRGPGKLDVRLLDVQMHWGGLPDHDATAPVLAVADTDSGAEAAPVDARKSRQLWPLVAGLLFLLTVSFLTFYLLQKRRVKAAEAATVSKADNLS